MQLEKKLSNRRHVVLIANRTILAKGSRKPGFKVRPRSRTLMHVQEKTLEDIVAPAEIVGKRTTVKVDGTTTMKVYLDPATKNATEDKLDTYQAVYKELTRKNAVFAFPQK